MTTAKFSDWVNLFLPEYAIQRKLQWNLRHRRAIHFNKRSKELREQGRVYRRAVFPRERREESEVILAELLGYSFLEFGREAQEQNPAHFRDRQEREYFRLGTAAERFVKCFYGFAGIFLRQRF